MATSNDPPARPTPTWFDEAKLGIFIHWTASAIPAFAPVPRTEGTVGQSDALDSARFDAEMYHNAMAIPHSATARHHAATYGDLPFDAFVHEFRDKLIPGWDPEPWAELFAHAGARYVVLCSKTEDGFLLWPSDHPNPHKPDWQAQRDVVGELAEATRRRGMGFGVYYSGGWDFTFGGRPVTGNEPFAQVMPQGRDYRDYVDAHWRELVQRYQPGILWNDYAASPPGADLDGLFRWYLKQVPDGVINDRFDERQESGELHADFHVVEYSAEESSTLKWEACRGLGYSFGYNRQEDDGDYLSPTELIHLFVDVVARGGNLLLNVGPTATGEIPWAQGRRLTALGQWLTTNGDAIYGSRPWKQLGGQTEEGTQIRYTTTTDSVHAIVLGTPSTASVDLNVGLDDHADISPHGWDGTLRWEKTPAGVRVELPEPPDRRPTLGLRISPATAVHPAICEREV